MSKIAIIGMSCLFPGANTPTKFYQNLLDNKDCTSLLAKNQIFEDPHNYFDPQKGKQDKFYFMKGGFIRDFNFESAGYSVDADYLEQLDDIHQWSLYVAREVLKDSGYLGQMDVLRRCGVVLGNLSFPTKKSNQLCIPIYHNAIQKQLNSDKIDNSVSFHNKKPDKIHLDNLRVGGYPAQLISRALGLSGISFSLDAACATSLYSIKLAIDYLDSGKADIMMAGAVSAADPFFINAGFSIFQAYSENGLSCPLDKRTEGLTAGEGAGMVLLKRYDTAVEDGDNIYGIIEGVGLSNDGAGKFILVPNTKGQVQALNRAYEKSGIDTKDISYVECHATGTPVGDTAEMQTLDTVFQKSATPPLVGSVKSGIGHLLTAAGMASFIKVVLSMNHGIIPATINVTEPSSSPDNIIKPDNIVTTNQPFPNRKQKYAAINAFGFGGTNAHLILGDLNNKNKPITEAEQTYNFNQRLAITGISANFGGEQDLSQLNYNLFNKKSGVREKPEERWNSFRNESEKGLFYSTFEMDFKYFKIPPNEISTLLPQQLLVLKTADAALKDAQASKGINAGVIIAMEPDLSLHQFRGRIEVSQRLDEYITKLGITLSPEDKDDLEKQLKDFVHNSVEINEFTSFIGNTMASRISALWDFNGPAFTVSEEENTFFRALEIAQLALAKKEVDMMVVGAVDMTGNVEDAYFQKILQSQQTIDFEKMITSEGVAVFVLKRSEEVTQSNQKVYAHIDGINLSIASAKSSELIKNDFKIANTKIKDVEYLDVAGSEESIEQLSDIFNQKSSTHVGRMSDHFDRLCCTRGAASLLKSVLAVYYKFLPESSQKLKLSSKSSRQTNTWHLKKGQTKRIASICHFNNDQNLSHLILSEHCVPQTIQSDYLEAVPQKLFFISASNTDHLKQNLEQFIKNIGNYSSFNQLSAQNIASYTTNSDHQKLSAVFIATNLDKLEKDIQSLLTWLKIENHNQKEWSSPSGSFFTPIPLGKTSKIAYLYPGIHSNYSGMLKDVFQVFPEVYQIFESYDINPDEILNVSKKYLENPIIQIQQSAMAAIINTFIVKDVLNIKADAAIGYSLGFNNLMFALGYWQDLKSYFDYIKRSGLFKKELLNEMSLLKHFTGADYQKIKNNWRSYLVHGDIKKILQKIEDSPLVYSTLINTANEMVVSGDFQSCETLFTEIKCQFKPLDNIGLLHHKVTDNVAGKFEKWLDQSIELNNFNKQVSLFPVNPIEKVDDKSKIATKIAGIFSQTFDLTEQFQKAWQQGIRSFVELGPNSFMKRWIDNLADDQPCLSQSIDQPHLGYVENIFRLVAKLVSNGHYVDLTFLNRFISSHKTKSKTNCSINIGCIKPKPDLKTYFDQQPPAINKNKPNNIAVKENVKISVPSDKRSTKTQKSIDSNKIDVEAFYDYRSQLNQMQSQFLEGRRLGLSTIKDNIANQISGVSDHSTISSNEKLPVETKLPVTKPEKSAIYSEADLMEFAEGKIANVFGEEYAIIDTYPSRVRLPMLPYFLVTRVTAMEAEVNQFKPSSIVTEYDVPHNAWYSVDGQIPWAVAVESGQCDLLLISYMGIDFSAKGKRMYRLLDCTLTYMDKMPHEGDTLRYEIYIDSFARQGETLLFFFRYDCFVEDRLVLKMTGGCAGFFTIDELAKGKGVLLSDKERKDRANIVKKSFQAFLSCQKTRFNRQELIDIVHGEMASCFGAKYNTQGANPSLRFSAEQILMHDRIISVDTTSGLWGLGEVISEKDLSPEEWFFPCHFKDDQVMAGSLMAEGCVQLLQFYALYIGLHTQTKNARFQPIKKLSNIVKCRGQVVPTDRLLTYKMEVTDIGLKPNPYAKANVDIILEGRVVVSFRDVGIELVEK